MSSAAGITSSAPSGSKTVTSLRLTPPGAQCAPALDLARASK
ncbi:hypothetical protein I551_8540 [Mycobacterium ulcerans str. Harvey]|uniref:Uncharacterized protein n=1 Tax=Mycobacterium ulcerans str. Harvey TaxID=1299332 RepID=A0ABN0RB19_MYCUL|nr:hypothetical protein I551_8540 [Mycobacterium ulcerans str. Harvey]